MKRLILPALCFTGVLTLGSVWAASEGVTQDSSALSQIPPPAGVGEPSAAQTTTPGDYSAQMNQANSNAAAMPWRQPADPAAGTPASSAGQSSPVMGQGSPSAEQGSPATGQGSFSAEQSSPVMGQDSPSAEQGSPATGQGSFSAEQSPPVMGQGSPSAEQGSPATGQGSFSAEQGSPATGQGLFSAEQSSPATGQDSPSAEQGSPATGQDFSSAEQNSPAMQQGSPAVEQYAPAGAPSQSDPATGLPAGLPPLPAPVVSAPAASTTMLNQPLSSTVSVGQMGQTNGILLTGGQLQSGIVFTLPTDEVITNARLNLSLKVSPALAARNTSLQLMLNGQPLGTLPLSASDNASEDYQLDIPAAMVVSSNNLSFKINDADQLLCERDSASQYQVTILPKTTLSLEGQQLNIGNVLRNFPRPFIDPLRMTPSVVTMVFGQAVSPGEVSAAAIVSSWMGIQTDYRGISFPVLRNELPEKNGIVFARPGQMVAGIAIPNVTGPVLQIMDNPVNPVYKLMLVIGKTDDQLRQAAWRLTQPLSVDVPSLAVATQNIPVSKPYDAPRWINTDRPVRLSDLLRKDQSMTTTGIWHDALRVNFRAAPDLFLWDGDTIPVELNYRFPSETWIDEDKSFLNVTLNGTFLRNLSVNKEGLLENIWHRLGGDARQENYTLKLDPYLIYGDNQLQLYFNIKPKEDAPCSVLTNNNIKSRIEDNAYIDLSNTRHFTLLPNLSYFVGASFPFTRLADYSQTVLLLPSMPGNTEISTLLEMAGRSGNATGVALSHNSVMFGIPAGGTALERLRHSDVLAVSTLSQTAFNQAMLQGTAYELNGHTLGVKEPTLLDNLRGWLTGDWYRQAVDADRYFSSNEDWRGFISYGSPWNNERLVVMTVATDDAQLSRLHRDLTSPRINAGIRGDTAIITDENGIRSFRVGAQFPSGQMPWYMMVIWYASQHAVVLALLALLFSVLVGLSTAVLLKRHAWKRLNPQNDPSPGEKKS